LNDSYPAFVVQVSCQNAYPESSANLGYRLLKQGAIGTISGTRNTYYALGSWSPGTGTSYGDNASYGYYCFDQMANSGEDIGTALVYCRLNFGTGWTAGYSWMNMVEFTIYGDPSLKLDVVTIFLTENFESAFVSGAPPGWTKAYQTGTVDWARNVGDHSSGDAAHGGTYNAMLYSTSTSDHKTYLITPVIDFGTGTTNATLEFWHKQKSRSGKQDTLNVYYKTSIDGSWILLASYTTDNVTDWTKRTISLPNLGSTYYIGFLGNAKGGYGVCIDDVQVRGIIPQHTISGHVLKQNGSTPVEDVLMQTDDNDVNTVTDVNGFYELCVDHNWSGTVIPQKVGYVFEPNKMEYVNVKSDSNNQDYIGTLLTFIISGHIKNSCDVPIAGVLVEANNGGGQDITDVNGFYEVWVDYNWSGTVTPTKGHHTFNPGEMVYVDVLADQTEQNYQAINIYDLDCDCSIGFGDLRIISENWLDGPDLPGDFYKDEGDIVNFLDFAEFAKHWLEGTIP
jgi:hypothetical protein